MPLNMRNESIFARHDLAFAMNAQGMPIQYIQEQCNYSDRSSVYRAIRSGAERARVNINRVSPRMFGVEIEFNRTSQTAALNGIRRIDRNVNVNIEGYNHQVRSNWKLITDASVSGVGTGVPYCSDCSGNRCGFDPNSDSEDGDGCREDCSCHYNSEGNGAGLEIVSPILRGADGFRQVESVLKGIRSVNGGVDRSCGLHVHHDARDLTPAAISRLIGMYVDNQELIDTMLPPSRRSTNSRNQWCRGWHESEKRELKAAEPGRYGYFDRYKTINVTSYPKYGSIEIRQHQGTLNFNKISNWVRFGQSLVEASSAITAAPATFDDLDSMLGFLMEHGKLPETTKQYLLARADGYASTRAM